MAKRRNKAAKIREALDELGTDASAKDVIAALAARRVRVTPQQVYNVRSLTVNPKASDYDQLIQAKRLADALGGIDEARAALAALAKLL